MLSNINSFLLNPNTIIFVDPFTIDFKVWGSSSSFLNRPMSFDDSPPRFYILKWYSWSIIQPHWYDTVHLHFDRDYETKINNRANDLYSTQPLQTVFFIYSEPGKQGQRRSQAKIIEYHPYNYNSIEPHIICLDVDGNKWETIVAIIDSSWSIIR